MGKLKVFLSNVTYSIFANALNLIVSAATSVLIPVILGDKIDQYGYFQIYLFYVAYIGFFHFGLCDGALLIEGGKDYSELNKSKYSFQYYFLAAEEFIISSVIVLILFILNKEIDYIFIGITFGLNLLVYLPRNLLAYLLQSSNRIKENAFITIIGRTTYLFLVLILCGLGYSDYHLFIIADIIGKIFALLYAIYQCKDIVFTKPESWETGIIGVKNNIVSGIKLMFASVSSMIITGIVRFAIQQQWDVATYGKVSLTLSITNLVLTFISAMAIVLYPTLRRVSKERAISLYNAIRDIIMLFLLATLVFCFPLQLIMLRILPQYRESLLYLPILFPICIYSAKVTMLVQTYMQVFRMEQQILKVNLIAIVIAFINTVISVFIMHDLTLAIFSILITAAIRSTLAECVLAKQINISIWKDSIVESLYVMFYVVISYFIGMKMGMLVYIPFFITYAIIKNKSIREAINTIKEDKQEE